MLLLLPHILQVDGPGGDVWSQQQAARGRTADLLTRVLIAVKDFMTCSAHVKPESNG